VIQQQQTYYMELYRSGMRAVSDMMRASLENAQRMQAQQAEAVRTAMEENAKAARELSEVKSLDEMMALQTRVLGSQLERSADVWSRLWRTASESQVAMIGQVQNQVGQMSDTVRQTYAFSTRAAEDAARSVAAQAGNAANAARESERKTQERERKSA
jgi:phasin family protein